MPESQPESKGNIPQQVAMILGGGGATLTNDQIQARIRQMLIDHGITDKDKLEAIPPALAMFFYMQLLEYMNTFQSQAYTSAIVRFNEK